MLFLHRTFKLAERLGNKRKKDKKSSFVICGWRDDSEIQRKSDQIYSILVSHYSEIMAMREQVQLIRGFLLLKTSFHQKSQGENVIIRADLSGSRLIQSISLDKS